jgi:uncharacterized membrane protein
MYYRRQHFSSDSPDTISVTGRSASMATEDEERAGHKANLDRLLALSDGVFAVAITLLVLDIKVPERVSGHLLVALLQNMPSVQSYIISFAVIGIYWNAHRGILHSVQRFDGALAALNLLFLFFIAFLPVPTAILGQYGNSLTATIIYALSMDLVGISSFLLWWYISANYRLLDATIDRQSIASHSFQILIPPLVFLLSIGVAFLNIFAPAVPGPQLAQYFWLLIAVLQFAQGRWWRVHRGRTT